YIHADLKRMFYAPNINVIQNRHELSHGFKSLFSRMLQHANAKGECWATESQLAFEIGVSDRQVRRYVVEGLKWKLIEVTRHKNRKTPNTVRFPDHPWYHACEDKS